MRVKTLPRQVLFYGVALLVFMMASMRVHASPLRFGPLRLGMTNSEAAKLIALRDCKQDGAQLVCTGVNNFVAEASKMTLKFDKNSKRLESVELRLEDWRSDDPRLPGLYSKLNFHRCHDDMVGSEPDWFVKEECFESPNQVRRITWDGGSFGKRGRPGIARSISVAVFASKGTYDTFMRKKAAERKRERQVIGYDRFSRGN